MAQQSTKLSMEFLKYTDDDASTPVDESKPEEMGFLAKKKYKITEAQRKEEQKKIA